MRRLANDGRALFVVAAVWAMWPIGARASDCSDFELEEVVDELEVRDFLNRVPPQLRRDRMVLQRFRREVTSTTVVNIQALVSLLEEAQGYGLPRSYEGQVRTWLREARAIPDGAHGRAVALAEEIEAALAEAAASERSSSVEWSEQRAAALEGVGTRVRALVTIKEEVEQTFLDESEFAPFNVHARNLESLVARAQSDTRPLQPCKTDVLYELLRKYQELALQIHDDDNRAPVPHSGEGLTVSGAGCASPLLVRRSALQAVGALVSASSVAEKGGRQLPLTSNYGEARGLCPGELFERMPIISPPVCTAFIVRDADPTIVATAGHCIEQMGAGPMYFVANYLADPSGSGYRNVSELQVVRVSANPIARGSSSVRDWALLRLEGPIEDAGELALNAAGRVAKGTPLLVIGHPEGLPLIYASNGEAKETDRSLIVFGANVDALGGNSGSPVLNLCTGLVEGVLAKQDARRPFRNDGGCNRVLPCNGVKMDCLWEQVVRIQEVAQELESFVNSLPRGEGI